MPSMHNFKKGEQFLFRYYGGSKNNKDTLKVESIYEVIGFSDEYIRIVIVKNIYAENPLWEETPGRDYEFFRKEFEAALRGKVDNKEVFPVSKEEYPEYYIWFKVFVR